MLRCKKGSAAIERSKTSYLLFKGATKQTVRQCDCDIVRLNVILFYLFLIGRRDSYRCYAYAFVFLLK